MNGLLLFIALLPLVWLAVLAAPIFSYLIGRAVRSPFVWVALFVLIGFLTHPQLQ
jgi:hypothetical protein